MKLINAYSKKLLQCVAALAILPLWGISSPILISRTSSGLPGDKDSGFATVFGNNNIGAHRSPITTAGAVYFISSAQLAPVDSNTVSDFYVYRHDHGVELFNVQNQIVSNACPANGGAYWIDVNATDTIVYFLREAQLSAVVFTNNISVQQMQLLSSVACRPNVYHLSLPGIQSNLAFWEANSGTRSDIFLHDYSAHPNNPINLTASANNSSYDPEVSDDGKLLVFSSDASNIISADTNGTRDIFLHNRANGSFTMISERNFRNLSHSFFSAETPVISGDGKVVAFISKDSGLVYNDTNGTALNDIFLWKDTHIERLTNQGIQSNGNNDSPRLNQDGRFMVFRSNSSNWVTGVGNGFYQIYLFDHEVYKIQCISLNHIGIPANADCLAPEISPNGRYITFVTKADNLSVDTNGKQQIYLVDRGQHFANHPPTALNKTVSGIYHSPPADSIISFNVGGFDLDNDELTFKIHALPHDGTLQIKINNAITSLNIGIEYPLSSSSLIYTKNSAILGELITMTYTLNDGVNDSSPATVKLRFVDGSNGLLERASQTEFGIQGNGSSFDLTKPGLDISGNGEFVVFSSRSEAFDPENNGFADVFLKNTQNQQLTKLSFGFSGNSYYCVISGDGSQVVYYTEDEKRLIVQDMFSQRRTVLDVFGSDLSSSPSISHDGLRVVYEKSEKVYLYDFKNRSHPKQFIADGRNPYISANGNVIVFARDNTTNSTLHLYYVDDNHYADPMLSGNNPRLSMTGRFLIHTTLNQSIVSVQYTDLVANAATISLEQANSFNIAISDDGRFVYYTTKIVAQNPSQAYRKDVFTGQNHLVSYKNGSEGNGTSTSGALSADGHLVVFMSDANNLIGIGNDTNNVSDIFINDLGLTNHELPGISGTTTFTVEKNSDPIIIEVKLTGNDIIDIEVDTVIEPEHDKKFVLLPFNSGTSSIRVIYAPQSGIVGSDTFQFRLRDGAGHLSELKTVNITIIDSQNPKLTVIRPLLLNETVSEGIIDNDMVVVESANPSADLQLQIVSHPEFGTLRFQNNALGINDPVPYADFSLIYTVNGNVNAYTEDEFQLRAIDNQASSESLPTIVKVFIRGARQSINLTAGWNLISFTSAPTSNLLPQQIFRMNGVNVLAGENWYWNHVAQSLNFHYILRSRRGYWIYSIRNGVVDDIPGPLFNNYSSVNISSGWNLVGPSGLGVHRVLPGIGDGIMGSIWYWDALKCQFIVASELKPNRGYWMFSNGLKTTIDLRLID